MLEARIASFRDRQTQPSGEEISFAPSVPSVPSVPSTSSASTAPFDPPSPWSSDSDDEEQFRAANDDTPDEYRMQIDHERHIMESLRRGNAPVPVPLPTASGLRRRRRRSESDDPEARPPPAMRPSWRLRMPVAVEDGEQNPFHMPAATEEASGQSAQEVAAAASAAASTTDQASSTSSRAFWDNLRRRFAQNLSTALSGTAAGTTAPQPEPQQQQVPEQQEQEQPPQTGERRTVPILVVGVRPAPRHIGTPGDMASGTSAVAAVLAAAGNASNPTGRAASSSSEQEAGPTTMDQDEPPALDRASSFASSNSTESSANPAEAASPAATSQPQTPSAGAPQRQSGRFVVYVISGHVNVGQGSQLLTAQQGNPPLEAQQTGPGLAFPMPGMPAEGQAGEGEAGAGQAFGAATRLLGLLAGALGRRRAQQQQAARETQTTQTEQTAENNEEAPQPAEQPEEAQAEQPPSPFAGLNPASMFGGNPEGTPQGGQDYDLLMYLSELIGQARPRNAPRKDVEKLEEFTYRADPDAPEAGFLDVSPSNSSTESEENEAKEEQEQPVSLHTSSLHGSTGDKCTICLNTYEEGEKLRMLKCRHAYHKECLDNWWVFLWRAKSGHSLLQITDCCFSNSHRLVGYVNSCPMCRSEGVEKTSSSTTENAQEEEDTPAARRRAMARRLFETSGPTDGNVPPIPNILRALLGNPAAVGIAAAAAANAAPGVRWRGPVPAVVGPLRDGVGVMAGRQGTGGSVGLMFWLG